MEKDYLSMCLFYKGENDCPEEYEGRTEGELWAVEREAYRALEPGTHYNPVTRVTLNETVSALIKERCADHRGEAMDVYFARLQEREGCYYVRKICENCIYFIDDENPPTCVAFIDGIPDEYVSGRKQHFEVDERQTTKDFVFEEKCATRY